MLEQSYFLLQFFWIFFECILLGDILSVTGSPLHIINMVAVRIQDYLGRIIKEHAGRFIGKVVAKPIFSGVVDPFFHPHFCFAWQKIYFSFWKSCSFEVNSASVPFVAVRECTDKTICRFYLLGWPKIIWIVLALALVLDKELTNVSLGWRTS